MSTRASEIIVLCEDKLHEVFARRFLTKTWGIAHRIIRVPPYPAKGDGSAESHVRTEFPGQLTAYRSRRAGTVLVAVMDADTGTVREHHRELDASARKAGLVTRTAEEKVVYVVPKRSIDTWLAYLDGVAVDEGERDEAGSGKYRFKAKYGFKDRESEAHPLIDKLAEQCRARQPLTAPPESLIAACTEFERIRRVL